MNRQVLRAHALHDHTPLPSSSSSLFIRNDPSGCMGAFLEEQESWIFGSHFMTCPYAVTRHREQLRGGGTRQCSSSPRVPGGARREADNDAASSPRPSPASPGTPSPSLTFLVSFTSFLPSPSTRPSYTSRQPTGTSPTSSAPRACGGTQTAGVSRGGARSTRIPAAPPVSPGTDHVEGPLHEGEPRRLVLHGGPGGARRRFPGDARRRHRGRSRGRRHRRRLLPFRRRGEARGGRAEPIRAGWAGCSAPSGASSSATRRNASSSAPSWAVRGVPCVGGGKKKQNPGSLPGSARGLEGCPGVKYWGLKCPSSTSRLSASA